MRQKMYRSKLCMRGGLIYNQARAKLIGHRYFIDLVAESLSGGLGDLVRAPWEENGRGCIIYKSGKMFNSLEKEPGLILCSFSCYAE